MTENTKVLKAIKYARSMYEVMAAGFAYDKLTESASVRCEVCKDKSKGWVFHFLGELGFVFDDS